MTIKIYKPSRTAMQSGIGNTKKWLAEYLSEEETVKDHLMGWNSSADTKTQIKVFREQLELAKDLDIITIIDGAHVPAQMNLNIRELGADIYTGACHKWMLCPKGVSFLYCSKKLQEQLEPLVVSWGWDSDYPSDSKFLDYHQYQWGER